MKKNINYGEYKHTRTRISVVVHTNTPSVATQGNLTAIRYRNDVIQSVLLHIRANLGMVLARDYTSCHAARSTLVMSVANNVQKLSGSSRVLFIICVQLFHTSISIDIFYQRVHGTLL